ncbi:CD74 molecule, major histocompatibility complex, class II invariant chain b [Hoplias malabaricus]|uniref:CD74 molecule, major histocompatibility complex, class II invariant chain b n=1 Tax=Hoplias malabaricus TaxID=27720 RepID=UPI0034631EE6
MSDQEGPLLRAPTTGGSNKRALKVAGLTFLAGVLIVGQAFTTYMVFSQKERLTVLERHSVRLEELGRRATVMRTPVKMARPMSSLPLFMDIAETAPKVTSAPPPKTEMTQCQLQAAGLVQVQLPSYKPSCDKNGDFEAQQCWETANKCWCVDKTGTMLQDSMVDGPAKCGQE